MLESEDDSVLKIAAEGLYQESTKNIYPDVKYYEYLNEINYNTIAVITLSTINIYFSLVLGFKKLDLSPIKSFLFYGFSKEMVEEFSLEFIPKGIELIHIQNNEDFNKIINKRAFDLIIIDYFILLLLKPCVYLVKIIKL